MLNHRDIAIAKGMLRRGDNVDDIASYLGTNKYNIELVKTGERGDWIQPVPKHHLPAKGSRVFSRKQSQMIREKLHDMETISTLKALRSVIDVVIKEIETAPETGEVLDKMH